MKTISLRPGILGYLLLLSIPACDPHSQAAEGGNPLLKPEHDRPETLEELKKDPNYKRAPIMEKPGAPLHDRKFKVGNDTDEKTAWEWHKNGMHFEAVKRSNQDRQDLRSAVQKMVTPRTPETAASSSFEEVKMSAGDTLTIFRPTNLDAFINPGCSDAERQSALQAAIALGKAFFWDTAFSSDQKVSCATCHYAAGTDHRTRGVVSLPANLGIHIPWPDPAQPAHYKAYELSIRDLLGTSPELKGTPSPGVFDPESISGFRLREVIGSLGVPHKIYGGLKPDGSEAAEEFAPRVNPNEGLSKVLAAIHRIETSDRQVTPRNAGTVINAVFNSRNFHDSRASMVFNGHTGWGQHTDEVINKALFIWRADSGKPGQVFTWSPTLLDPATLKPVLDASGQPQVNPHYIANAALASQAVEPILSDVEMSYRGRMFHHIARRMLSRPILAKQSISPEDSSLGSLAKAGGLGGTKTYAELVQAAFRKEWWDQSIQVSLNEAGSVKAGDGQHRSAAEMAAAKKAEYNLMEANFGLFWGLALHLYQSTLISDDSRFDREQRHIRSSARAAALDGRPPEAGAPALRDMQPLTAQEQRGGQLFQRHGCADCHLGAELSGGSIHELGLLKAWREEGTKVTETRTPAASAYDVPADILEPPVFAEDEPLLGQLACPTEQPFGVECMAFAGRMQSLYDGGNYVIGTSRYIRSPSWPAAPPIPNADGQLPHHYPGQTALWEDSGLGNYFIPNEVALEAEGDLPRLALRRFGQHLLAVDLGAPTGTNRIDALLKQLSPKAAKNESTPIEPKDTPAESSLQIALRDTGSTEAIQNYAFQKAERQEQASTKEVMDITNLPRVMANLLTDKINDSIKAVEVAEDTLKQELRNPLNYTQQTLRLESALEKLGHAIDTIRPDTAPKAATPKADQPDSAVIAQIAQERRLTISGGHYLVTPGTPAPVISLARRWSENLTASIVDAERRLSEASQAGDAVSASKWRQQLKALRGLQGQTERIADAGAFRAPTLRNIELTGPYMHNGSLLTLEAVIDFYARGGHFNRRIRSSVDDFKTGDLHPEMAPFLISNEDKAALVAFLKTLTDDRVKLQKAPFDHPSLDLPQGPAGNAVIKLPPVGKNGTAETLRIRSFAEVLAGDHGLTSGSSY